MPKRSRIVLLMCMCAGAAFADVACRRRVPLPMPPPGSIDGADVGNAANLPRLIETDQRGAHVHLRLTRKRRPLEVEFTLGATKRGPEGAAPKQQL